MNLNKALFGGALMAAGMTAEAQTFIYSATDTTGDYQSSAISYAYGGGYSSSTDSGALNTSSTGSSYGYGTTTVSTNQTANSMRIEGEWAGDGAYGNGYGWGFLRQYFQVSADADLLIEWNIGGTGLSSIAMVFEDPALNNLFELDGLAGKSSGSTTISLTAGSDYAVRFGWGGPFLNSTETQFIRVTLVEAPTECIGDVNNSGTVDLADLNIVLANFGTASSDGDANGDGLVDLADLNMVLANFGDVCD